MEFNAFTSPWFRERHTPRERRSLPQSLVTSPVSSDLSGNTAGELHGAVSSGPTLAMATRPGLTALTVECTHEVTRKDMTRRIGARVLGSVLRRFDGLLKLRLL